jgi:hypothetical protein
MSRSKDGDELVLGGEPRVDLLPPEVKAGKKVKATRRRLGAILIAVVVLMITGVGAATWHAQQSQNELASAQQRTAELLAGQAKYAEVNQVQNEVNLTVAARQFGASTEVDWKSYLSKVRAALPQDVSIDTVSVDSASPLGAYIQPTAPLQAARVATLTLAVTSPNLPSVPQWLDAIKGLPGYADATPGSIKRSDSGAYTVDLVLHINGGAYSNRFATPEGK